MGRKVAHFSVDRNVTMRYKTNMSSIPQKVIKAMKRLGMTHDELGAKIGVSGRTVRRWANGETSPKLEDWVKVESLLAQKRGAA